MPLQYQLASAVTVGQYPNQVTVTSLRLAAIAYNFEAAKSGAAPGVAAASVILEDIPTEHKFANHLCCDAAALALVQSMLAATNPATGNTYEADILAAALAATDPASGKPIIPPGGSVVAAPAVAAISPASPTAASAAQTVSITGTNMTTTGSAALTAPSGAQTQITPTFATATSWSLSLTLPSAGAYTIAVPGAQPFAFTVGAQ